jgi:hypothetical protein
MGSTLAGSSLACKYSIRLEVTNNDQRSSLLMYGRKKYYSTGPRGAAKYLGSQMHFLTLSFKYLAKNL